MWEQLARERTDLTEPEIAHIRALLREWTLLADLSLGDLVLWLPTWNEGGLVAVAQIRPTTAPTQVPDDVIGTFSPKGRALPLEQALAIGRIVSEAYPVRFGDRVIAVVARHTSSQPRVAGQLEEVYVRTANDLLQMLVEGTFPPPGLAQAPGESPRVGDGLVRLDHRGQIEYASPNAVSNVRRLGLATDLVGREFGQLAMRLVHKPGPMNEALAKIASGRDDGRVDLENGLATVLIQGLVLRKGGRPFGAIVLLRDVTDVRSRERALLSKEATIREIHHRVKNNLQTVAALLRLQARRASSEETRGALVDAQLRVSSIAVVHETLSREPGTEIAFADVVDSIVSLVRELAPAYAGEAQTPSIVVEGSCGVLPAEIATPLAMCIAELLQNAVEHAGATGITVTMEEAAWGVSVEVRDDGRGLPDGFTLAQAGLGLQIVESLAIGELHGSLELNSAAGGLIARLTASRA
jgi:two-component system, sensor histidine kinase PdtaS